MSKGLCTMFKVMGFVCGGVIVIFGIFPLITMLSSITGEYSSLSYDSGISFNSGTSTAVTMYVLRGLVVIVEGFVVFLILFALGSAGDYMRLKRQKEGLWGVLGQVSTNPFFSFEPAPVPQPQPERTPPMQTQSEPLLESVPPEQPQDGGDAGG